MSKIIRPTRPKFIAVLKLRCVLCGEEPLQKKGSWLIFRQGCPRCDYNYEREAGYFSGASWVIGYTFLVITVMIPMISLVILLPEINYLIIVGIGSLFAVFLGLLFSPFSKSLWMYLDHLFHPLKPEELKLKGGS